MLELNLILKNIDKLNFAKIYNSLVVSHLFSLCPVWQFFSEPQKLCLSSIFFLLFLLSYPPWTRNSCLMSKFRLVSPISVTDKRLHDFCSMLILSHPWSALFISLSLGIYLICIYLQLFLIFFYYSILRAICRLFVKYG